MGNGASIYDHFELCPSSGTDYGHKSWHHCTTMTLGYSLSPAILVKTFLTISYLFFVVVYFNMCTFLREFIENEPQPAEQNINWDPPH